EGAVSLEIPPSFAVLPAGAVARKLPEDTMTNPPEGGTTSVGKIILYADRDIVAPDLTQFVSRPLPWLGSSLSRDNSLPRVADIPPPGQAIARGHPICTLFARAPSESGCLAELIRCAERFERTLG